MEDVVGRVDGPGEAGGHGQEEGDEGADGLEEGVHLARPVSEGRKENHFCDTQLVGVSDE